MRALGPRSDPSRFVYVGRVLPEDGLQGAGGKQEARPPHLGGCQGAGGDLAVFCIIQPRPHKETAAPLLRKKMTHRDNCPLQGHTGSWEAVVPGPFLPPQLRPAPQSKHPRGCELRQWWWQQELDFSDTESMGLGVG